LSFLGLRTVVRGWGSCEPCYHLLLVSETVRCSWCPPKVASSSLERGWEPRTAVRDHLGGSGRCRPGWALHWECETTAAAARLLYGSALWLCTTPCERSSRRGEPTSLFMLSVPASSDSATGRRLFSGDTAAQPSPHISVTGRKGGLPIFHSGGRAKPASCSRVSPRHSRFAFYSALAHSYVLTNGLPPPSSTTNFAFVSRPTGGYTGFLRVRATP
jgi:hypothetical protein